MNNRLNSKIGIDIESSRIKHSTHLLSFNMKIRIHKEYLIYFLCATVLPRTHFHTKLKNKKLLVFNSCIIVTKTVPAYWETGRYFFSSEYISTILNFIPQCKVFFFRFIPKWKSVSEYYLIMENSSLVLTLFVSLSITYYNIKSSFIHVCSRNLSFMNVLENIFNKTGICIIISKLTVAKNLTCCLKLGCYEIFLKCLCLPHLEKTVRHKSTYWSSCMKQFHPLRFQRLYYSSVLNNFYLLKRTAAFEN